MSSQFFKPFVGKHYHMGVRGKKVLVLGASFYCNQVDCQFFKECTDVRKKDSSEFDAICPAYIKDGKRLSNEPSYCIGDEPKTYHIFAGAMQSLTDTDGYEQTWDRLAFTNYIQFFLPAEEGKFRDTRYSDMSERDFKALMETLKELQPDVVVVWGCVINSALKENNPHLVSIEELDQTEWYLCHIKIPGVDHQIAVVNPFHPSSSAWHSSLCKFNQYLTMAINE